MKQSRLLIYNLCTGMPGAVGGWLISEGMKASGKLCDSSVFSSEKDEQVRKCLRRYLHEVENKKGCSVEINKNKKERAVAGANTNDL